MVTDAMVEAAAKCIWDDFHGRYGGVWESQPVDGIAKVATIATARAALSAALDAQGAPEPTAAKFTSKELLILREAVRIGGEDGSLTAFASEEALQRLVDKLSAPPDA
jgi:hypothetical protein